VHDGYSASDEEPTACRSDILSLVDVYKLAIHRRNAREWSETIFGDSLTERPNASIVLMALYCNEAALYQCSGMFEHQLKLHWHLHQHPSDHEHIW
jgi:hypothetical protein